MKNGIRQLFGWAAQSPTGKPDRGGNFYGGGVTRNAAKLFLPPAVTAVNWDMGITFSCSDDRKFLSV